MEDQSGGKTAHGARPCSPGWVGNLMKLCSLCSRRTVNNSSRGRGQSLGSSIWWEFWSGSKKDLKDKLQEPFSVSSLWLQSSEASAKLSQGVYESIPSAAYRMKKCFTYNFLKCILSS